MFEERILSRHLAPVFKPTFWRTLRRAQPHSMVSKRRMQNLWRLLGRVARDGVAGDYVELGTARGGTALLLAAHRDLCGDAAREVWLYDAFEDFDPPAARFDDVARLLFDEAGHDRRHVHLVKGFFDRVLPDRPARPIALLHLDAGGYEGVRDALKLTLPHVAAGGWVVFDNYGVDEDCRRAVHEVLDPVAMGNDLSRFGHTQVYVQVPGP
ncbi:MAG: hypothetical protein CMJ83_00960 [Planctomycetes bacterium]|nr:hypothetical protein [Planctomycetota bacterium]